MKYVDGGRYRITKKLAAHNKKKFGHYIRQFPNWEKDFQLSKEQKNDFDFLSFSCTYDVEEQVLSILSLLKWYGQPANWYIYSDGTHTEADKKLLQSLGAFVKIREWNQNISRINHPLQDSLFAYAKVAALGKRLLCYITHPMERTTIFLDSDIIFYKHIKSSLEAIKHSSRNWFLPDGVWGTMDSRFLKRQTHEGMYQSNGGFTVLNPGFNWDKAIEFISTLNNQFEYFSEQTAMHVAGQSAGAYPLDPRKFIMHSQDQFLFSTLLDKSAVAIRHYTSPVRHKIWQNGPKWHLNA